MASISSYPEKYIEDFRRDYERYGKFDLEKQAPHLAGLAYHYKRRYHRTQDWTDCLKVGSAFYHTSSLCNLLLSKEEL